MRFCNPAGFKMVFVNQFEYILYYIIIEFQIRQSWQSFTHADVGDTSQHCPNGHDGFTGFRSPLREELAWRNKRKTYHAAHHAPQNPEVNVSAPVVGPPNPQPTPSRSPAWLSVSHLSEQLWPLLSPWRVTAAGHTRCRIKHPFDRSYLGLKLANAHHQTGDSPRTCYFHRELYHKHD